MPTEFWMFLFALVGLLGSWYLSKGILLIAWKVFLKAIDLLR